ncbi:hypothetical protein DXG01_016441 [Tephrocybe rancida]|nr:hypothetical protein DXG01_016441 [Tephrocybe rancida]
MHLVYRTTSHNILTDQPRMLSPTNHTPTTAPTPSTAGSSLSINGTSNIAPWDEPYGNPSPLTGGFSNPFLSAPIASKRSGRIYNRDSRRISPKDKGLDKSLPASPLDSGGPGGLSWTAPESWGVDKNDLEADYESSVDEDYGAADPVMKAAGVERPMSFAVPRIETVDLDPHGLEAVDLATNVQLAAPHPKHRKKG